MVWNANVLCTCDICQPRLYGKKNCSWPKHLTITLSENLEVNKYDRIVYSPPSIEPLAVVLPELVHLARTMIQYFDRPWGYLNDQQLNARERLMQWWAARNVGNGSWQPIEAEDAEKLVSTEDMLQLSTWLSELFFHGQFAGLQIKWDRDIEWIGQATYNGGSVLISMHPSKLVIN
jgi:hypothetical protein